MNDPLDPVLFWLCYDVRDDPLLLPIVEGYCYDHGLPPPKTSFEIGTADDWLLVGPSEVARNPLASVHFTVSAPWFVGVPTRDYGWYSWRAGDHDFSVIPPVLLRYAAHISYGVLIGNIWTSYKSDSGAREALSAICIRWAEDVCRQRLGIHLVC